MKKKQKKAVKRGAKKKGQEKEEPVRPVVLRHNPAMKKKGADVETKIHNLLKRGRDRGFVTYSEILSMFPTVEEDIGLLEHLYSRFDDATIEVLETKDLIEVPEDGAPKPRGRKR